MSDGRTLDDIFDDFEAVRRHGDRIEMARLRNEETCYVLLGLLERLAADPESFVHRIALKGGILMAGELGSPRVSADIDATSGYKKRIDPEEIVRGVRHAGLEFGVEPDGRPERLRGGITVPLRYDSRLKGGTAKLEISVREDPVFAVREALFCPEPFDIRPFTVPAIAEVELVAEKIRALTQRAQPRDLFDLWYYLVRSGWHLDSRNLREALDAKLALTRTKRWSRELWRAHLDDIEPKYGEVLLQWISAERLPAFDEVVAEIAAGLRALRLG
jgi:predicted nucleotidyltransferase component of viral defense system